MEKVKRKYVAFLGKDGKKKFSFETINDAVTCFSIDALWDRFSREQFFAEAFGALAKTEKINAKHIEDGVCVSLETYNVKKFASIDLNDRGIFFYNLKGETYSCIALNFQKYQGAIK